MEKRLHDAALEGDVTTLHELLGQDPLVLDKAAVKCEDKNPLHIAAMLGHVDFVKAILQVESAYFLCLARDRDGRNPLHLAAMNGRTEVLQVLLDARFQAAALEKTDGGGTILHLCVKYNQLEALEILVQKFKGRAFQDAKNEDGMTILHLAVYYHRNQMIKFLLAESRVWVREKDANGRTAVQLMTVLPIEDPELSSSLNSSYDKQKFDEPENYRETFKERRDALMVVASLIATMAFQAVINPPGGTWQDDLKEGPNPHRAGEPIMVQSHPTYYRHLIWASTIAFVSSLTIVILVMRGPAKATVPTRAFLTVLSCLMGVAIVTVALTYAISLVTLASKHARGGRLSDAAVIVLIVVTMFCCCTRLFINWLLKLSVSLNAICLLIVTWLLKWCPPLCAICHLIFENTKYMLCPNIRRFLPI